MSPLSIGSVSEPGTRKPPRSSYLHSFPVPGLALSLGAGLPAQALVWQVLSHLLSPTAAAFQVFYFLQAASFILVAMATELVKMQDVPIAATAW